MFNKRLRLRIDKYGVIWHHSVVAHELAGVSGIKSSYLTLVLHKIPAQNRFATSIAASKALYSFFLDLT